MVKHMEVVSTARPLEAIMTKPGSHRAVDDYCQGVHLDMMMMMMMIDYYLWTHRVKAQSNRDQCRRIVEGRLHRMHVCPREGCWVVRLVV